MSALGEKTLIQCLTDVDSVDVMVREGLEMEVVPTETLRPVVQFAIDYFFASGRSKAPSPAALRIDYGDLLDDHQIDVTVDPEESIEWALDDLKGSFVHKEFATFNRKYATAMAEATTAERLVVVSEAAQELVRLTMAMESHQTRIDMGAELDELMRIYEARTLSQDRISGMGFGMSLIDSYTLGIHDGELAIIAAPPKTGKSFFQVLIALKEWEAGRPTALFTLENSVETTMDRIACIACEVNGEAWQHGNCTAEDVEKVRDWISDMRSKMETLWIISPPINKRSFESMVREAQVLGAKSLLIDQLSFVDLPSPRKPKHERIGEGLHILKDMISTGRDRMACSLTHQINREGVKAAKKLGYLEMEHMAEAAEVERTGDWVFGMFQSHDEVVRGLMKFQTLGARRAKPEHFLLEWHLSRGQIAANQKITLPTAA